MYIKVKVTPGAKKEIFEEKNPDSFCVSVREKAERNMANNKVIELLAEHLKVPTGKIRLISGHHNRSKIFSIYA